MLMVGFKKLEKKIFQETANEMKQKGIKLAEISVLLALALILVSIGIAEMIGYYFPLLENGANYLILGFIFIIGAYLLEK